MRLILVFEEFAYLSGGHAGFRFWPEDGGSRFERNLGKFSPYNMALNIRRQYGSFSTW